MFKNQIYFWQERMHAWSLFAENGIPPEFLSHYIPDGPFTCIRLNDGLSD